MPRSLAMRYLALLLLLVPAVSHADTPEAKTRAIDVNLLRPVTGQWGLVTTEQSRTMDEWQWMLGLMYDYQRQPLTLRSQGRRVDDIVSDEQTAHVMFALGLPKNFEVGIELPIITRMDGSGGKTLNIPGVGHLAKQGFGDIRFTPKWSPKLLQRKTSSGLKFGIGFSAPMAFPTGKFSNFWGERSPNITPKVLFDLEVRRLTFTADLGYTFRNRAEFNGLVVGDEIIWGVGGKFRILEAEHGKGKVDKLAVIGEVYGRTNGNKPFKVLGENPMVGLLAVRYFLPKQNLFLTGGAARGIQGGYGAPVIQGFLSVGWSPAEKDSDGDGIPDRLDKCPFKPGPAEWQGCPDTDLDGVPDHKDKCPNEPGPESNDGCPIPDTDGDGIPDNEDKCPKEKGPKENKGCPWPDTDGDGIPDNEDKCPDKPGPISTQGCPDSDKDGIPDHLDKCPNEPGPKENDGCPVKAPEEPKPEPKPEPTPEPAKPDESKPQIKVDEKVIVLPQILFKLGSAEIEAASHSTLDALAKLLGDAESVSLRIEGHTDALGGKALNLKLSQRRAESVRKYLISKTVKPKRLVAIGLGNTKPLGKDRAKNRRVEFHITSAIPEGWKVK